MSKNENSKKLSPKNFKEKYNKLLKPIYLENIVKKYHYSKGNFNTETKEVCEKIIKELYESNTELVFRNKKLRNIYKMDESDYENYDEDEHGGEYLWTPDIQEGDRVDSPYMDRLGIRKGKYIGTNTKTLYLTAASNWTNTVISPKARIKELIIESVDLPANIFEVPFDLDWVKFKFIKIKSLSDFKIKSKLINFFVA